MAVNSEQGRAESLAGPAKLLGTIGLGLSLVGLLVCLVLFLSSLGRLDTRGHLLLYALLLGPVAGLGVWLFRDFLRLPDWTVAPEVPLGLKLLGNLGRVLGTLAAAACVALAILTIVYPNKVPPLPVSGPGGTASTAPRPALAAVYVFGIFGFLLIRMLGSSVAELRRWARLGSVISLGAAVTVFSLTLVFNYTSWKIATAFLPLWVLDILCLLLFLFVLGYFSLPSSTKAFEAHQL